MLLVVLLSLLVGATLGLLGGGGSILLVPVLVYAVGLPEKSAMATSLLVLAVTSAFAALPHVRAKHVVWRAALGYSPFAMVGAFAGGWGAQFVPARWLMVLFSVVMLVTAGAMWAGRTTEQRATVGLGILAAEGLGIGVVTGLVGAGGGFLVVPALVLLGGLSMEKAVGTSLVVIALNSAAGFSGQLSHVELDYSLAAVVAGGAVVGSLGGTLLGSRIQGASLRRGFAVLVVLMGVWLLGKQFW